MYIDNPKKLFKDLIRIPTMYDYMVAVEEDGMKDDLHNMVDIVYNQKDELWDNNHSYGEGSTRWDLAGFEGMSDEQKLRNEMIADSNVLKRIWRIIQKELNSKYVLVCNNCGAEYLYTKQPRYSAERYKCTNCGTVGALELIPFEQWATPEILTLKNKYR